MVHALAHHITRRNRLLLMVAAVMVVATYVASTAAAATQYRVTGRGWGHGIGMSQYGAQGFATHGYTAGQIIRYYYQGTTIGSVPAGARTVNVQLVSGRTAVIVRVDGSTATLANGSASYSFVHNDRIELRVDGAGMDLYRTRGSERRKLANNLAGVSVIGGAPSIATLFTAENGAYGHHYRGSLRIHRVGSTLSVINRVGIELYLRSVVPSEMPSGWHPEALKAQAIAARSYAIATRSSSGIYDLHSDTRSQMYLGIEHEESATNSAVQGTAGKAAKYGGSVIPAFFSSTSGGRTAAIEDVWGSPPRPYLKSVADPYESSPYSRWPEFRAYTPAGLAAQLNGYIAGSFRKARVTINPSRRADNVVVTGSGGTRNMPATTFQTRLGLRSTWFRIEQLTISAGTPSGGRVRVRGVVPGWGATYLMRRVGSTWAPIRRITPGPGGSFNRLEQVGGADRFGLKRAGHVGPVVEI